MAVRGRYVRRYNFHRYKTRTFQNPYFSHRPAKTSRWKGWLVGIASGAATIGAFYVLLFAPWYRIEDVEVRGLQYMPSTEIDQLAEEQVASKRFLVFSQRNRRFFRSSALEERLLERYAFETLTLDVKKGTLIISVTERISQVLWQSGDQTFYVDVKGTIIRVLPAADQEVLALRGGSVDHATYGPFRDQALVNTLPLIIDVSESVKHPGDVVLTPTVIAGIINFEKNMQEKGIAIRVFFVERPDAIWATAETQEGFDIKFDASGSVVEQGNYVQTILNTEVQDRTKLEYIDVRFGDHVYFKGGE